MGPFALSHQQQALWLLAHIIPAPQRCALNLCYQIRLQGHVHDDAMSRAIAALGHAHPTLRTRIWSEEGTLWQAVATRAPTPCVVDVEQYDDPEAAADRYVATEAMRAMDLDGGSLAFFGLVRIAPGARRVVMNLHHAIADGSSFDYLRMDLAALYSSFARGLPPPPLAVFEPSDFVSAQHERFATPAFGAATAYWAGEVAAAGPPAHVRYDYPAPATRSFTGDWIDMPIPAELAAACQRASFRLHVPLSGFLLGAFAMLLAHENDSPRMTLGTVFSGRNAGDAWHRAIGMYANTVPLCLRLDLASTLPEAMRHVGSQYERAYDYQDVPLQSIERMSSSHDGGPPRLFSVVFAYQTGLADGVAWADLTELGVERVCTNTISLDLVAHVLSSSNGMSARFDYCTDLFARSSMVRLAERYVDVLRVFAHDSGTAAIDALLTSARMQVPSA